MRRNRLVATILAMVVVSVGGVAYAAEPTSRGAEQPVPVEPEPSAEPVRGETAPNEDVPVLPGAFGVDYAETTFACDGTTREAVTLTGANPDEGIVLASDLFEEPIPIYADADGEVGIPWTCQPDQADLQPALTATGSESERTIDFTISTTPGTVGLPAPSEGDQPPILEPDTRADEVVADELRDYLSQHPEALVSIGPSINCLFTCTSDTDPPPSRDGLAQAPPKYQIDLGSLPNPYDRRCQTRYRPPLGGNERDVLDDRTLAFPRPANAKPCWSLVATGDSVTSAHNQQSSGLPLDGFPCPGTVDNGNDHMFSYAHRAFMNDDRFQGGAYYNFARTGFTTTNILKASGDEPDACANPWQRTIRYPGTRGHTPVWHLRRAIDYEHQLGNNVAWVATGGVNNANWGPVLATFKTCDVLRRVLAGRVLQYQPPGVGMVVGTATGEVVVTPTRGQPTTLGANVQQDTASMAALLERGGSCKATLKVKPKLTDEITLLSTTVDVPLLDLRAKAAEISIGVTEITRAGDDAGVDKLVWLGYYDISPTEFDVRGLVSILGLPAQSTETILLALRTLGVPARLPVASTMQERTIIRQNVDLLSSTVCKAVALVAAQAPPARRPTLTCIKWQDAGITRANEIQGTIPGGAPHPNDEGHKQLAFAVVKALAT